MKSKGKKKSSSLSLNMKKATGSTKGVLIKRGEWEKNRKSVIEQRQAKHKAKRDRSGQEVDRDNRDDVYQAMITRVSEGATHDTVADEFGVHKSVIAAALKHKFMDGRKGGEILRSLLLENAIVLGVQTNEKRKDLNAMQSAVATGIMTSNFINLDKHIASKPREMDTESLSEIGKQLGELNNIVKNAGIDLGPEADEIEGDDD